MSLIISAYIVTTYISSDWIAYVQLQITISNNTATEHIVTSLLESIDQSYVTNFSDTLNHNVYLKVFVIDTLNNVSVSMSSRHSVVPNWSCMFVEIVV